MYVILEIIYPVCRMFVSSCTKFGLNFMLEHKSINVHKRTDLFESGDILKLIWSHFGYIWVHARPALAWIPEAWMTEKFRYAQIILSLTYNKKEKTYNLLNLYHKKK